MQIFFLAWLWMVFLPFVLGQDAEVHDEAGEVETAVAAPSHGGGHGHQEHKRFHQKQWIRSESSLEKRGSSTFVFFHYMIGTVTDPHAQADVQAAVAAGVDAFALNIADVTSSWSLNTCSYLFKYAQANNFKLFFSFDMNSFSNPNQFTNFLKGYVTNSAYFKYNGSPLVSTFNGGAGRYATSTQSVNQLWQQNLKDVMSNNGTPIVFMPAWSDVQASSSFFNNYPVCDGAMNWDSWPFQSDGMVNVSTSIDTTYQNAAKSAGKKFIMGASPLQFKHLDSYNNFYRRGRGNFDNRISQILNLQPDMVEFQTWNDVGEAHNMGKAWPEGISCCANIQAYSVDHLAFLEIMPTLTKAIKTNGATLNSMLPSNGKQAQGIFYYHKLLANGNCGGDSIGKPSGSNLVEDVITSMVYLTTGIRSWKLQVYSNNQLLSTTSLTQGYNNIETTGVQAGPVKVNIVDGTGTVKFTATGPNPVMASSSLCNYNIEVAALASV